MSRLDFIKRRLFLLSCMGVFFLVNGCGGQGLDMTPTVESVAGSTTNCQDSDRIAAGVTVRPSKVCGINGTIDARIADCEAVNGTSSYWEGSKVCGQSYTNWKLVTAYDSGNLSSGASCAALNSNECYEVWKDMGSGQVWSDVMFSATVNDWFLATGQADSGGECGGLNCNQSSDDACILSFNSEFKGNIFEVSWSLPNGDNLKTTFAHGYSKILREGSSLNHLYWYLGSSPGSGKFPYFVSEDRSFGYTFADDNRASTLCIGQ